MQRDVDAGENGTRWQVAGGRWQVAGGRWQVNEVVFHDNKQ